MPTKPKVRQAAQPRSRTTTADVTIVVDRALKRTYDVLVATIREASADSSILRFPSLSIVFASPRAEERRRSPPPARAVASAMPLG